MKKILALLFVLGMAACAATAGVAWLWWTEPPARTSGPVDYEVLEGATLGAVASDLEARGVLRWAVVLRLWTRATGQGTNIKAGTYRFEPGMLPKDVLDKLVKGQIVTIRFNIPEGLNRFQIAEKLVAVFPHVTKEAWLTAMESASLRASLPTNGKNLEGVLFPETYTIRPKPSAQEVVSMMIATFRKHFTEDIVASGRQRGLTPLQIVTLASIIEKETGKASERPRISAVFHNRMRKGMLLQTDPTVIYGIWEKFDGNLRKIDLQTPNPYNTYMNKGLPPGPIANPGLASLRAAVSPETSPDLYFVGKGDGSHHFSATLQEHNRAVHEYQIKPFSKKRKK